MTIKQLTVVGLVIGGIGLVIPFILKNPDINIQQSGSALAINSAIEEIHVTNNYENKPDPSYENPRIPELSAIEGEELIQTWFDFMNEGKWKEACSLMAKDKCDSSNGDEVLEHSREPRLKTINGYENVEVWHADSAPNDLWCVKYKYRERQSAVSRDIVFIMQYKLSPRSENGEDIASRLCEKEWKEGLGDQTCRHSIVASNKFCI